MLFDWIDIYIFVRWDFVLHSRFDVPVHIVLDLSPFWRVAVLDTTKTATNPKRRHVKTAAFWIVAVLTGDIGESGTCPRMALIAINIQ